MVNKKRYQIFVSSTFADLKEERKMVMHAILERKGFPAGMELFPAKDKKQFDYIRQVINDSDYYLLIIGARYGSLDDDGVSYTEKEYDYAVSQKIPVIAFLHSDIKTIPLGKADVDKELQQKLEAFRAKVQTGRLVNYWENAHDLKAKVISSLVDAFEDQDRPRIGWVRADLVNNGDSQKEIERLKKEIEKQQNEVKRFETKVEGLQAALKQKDEIGSKNANLIGRLISIEQKLSLLPSSHKKEDFESNIRNDIDTLYRESQISISVLIHGKSFISAHANAIISRFNKFGSESKWFFLNPESVFIELVAKRTQKTHSNEIKQYITEKVEFLINEYEKSSKLGMLEIFYMDIPPMQAVYVFDNTIVEGKYYSSNGKMPADQMIVYENISNENSIGFGFANDCRYLEKESNCAFSSRYVESDQQFHNFIQKKDGLKDLLGENYSTFIAKKNSCTHLSFTPVYHRNKQILQFSYRFYEERNEFTKNKNFYENQFIKKMNELVCSQGVIPPRLFFIVGIGGTASSPKSFKIFQYNYPKEFIPVSGGKKMTLKNFGYNPDLGKWKDS